MQLGFTALLSRDWPMAIGDSLNPNCTVRAFRMPRLFMSTLAQRRMFQERIVIPRFAILAGPLLFGSYGKLLALYVWRLEFSARHHR